MLDYTSRSRVSVYIHPPLVLLNLTHISSIFKDEISDKSVLNAFWWYLLHIYSVPYMVKISIKVLRYTYLPHQRKVVEKN